jgi:putative ABC transport system permease protein
MRALDRKLLRDLAAMKGQVVTIALIVACGIASYVTIEGTHASLLAARDGYYERRRFPDVFAHLKSAPESLRARLEAIDGIAIAQTRLVSPLSFPGEYEHEPASGHVISLPAHEQPPLATIQLVEGRMFQPDRTDEAVVLEAFARARGLRLGDRLPVLMAGTRRAVEIVGIAIAPEYVFAMVEGELIPDPRRFGVLWMDRRIVAAAYELEGAFNDLVVRLQPGASERAVIEQLNRELAPYGGLGAHGRDRQPSNNVLRGELAQLETLTRLMPAIFLGVAAFLINVVLSRLVQLQRAQIATLKAVGYSRLQVGRHYLELVSVIVLAGSLLGIGAGIYLGGRMTDLYTRYFRFPALDYQLDARVLTLGVAISLLAAFAGAVRTVRAVMRLPPAEAMRPEAPAIFRAGLSGRLRVGNTTRMVLRQLERRPLRALLSSVGIAMGVAVLVAGRFGYDAVHWFMHVQFELSQREDLTVTFRHPVSDDALRELAHLPGVRKVEGLRAVAVRYRSGQHARESLLFGHPPAADLRHVLDREGRRVLPPEQGIVLTSALGEILGLRVGDDVTIEPLEGQRRERSVVVAGFVDEVLGLFGHMQASAVSRLLGEQAQVSQALLEIDPTRHQDLLRELRRRPVVLGVARRDAVVEQFRKQTAGQMRYTTLILTLFAAIIASGVVYNNARIALSTRSRDLASLRVLGFRRGEISAMLLGELAVQVVIAILPGMFLGRLLCEQMMAGADQELYRFPVVVSARTYAFAALVTLGASLASALVVRSRLDHLDLIGVLKSRD